MDLLCCETECSCRAYADLSLLGDDRVLRKLLSEEDRFTTNISYFDCVQRELSPDMRRIVADWMMEVSVCCFIHSQTIDLLSCLCVSNDAEPVWCNNFPVEDLG